MLRFILIIGNALFGGLLIYGIFTDKSLDKELLLIFIPLVILFFLNVCYLLEILNKDYQKRKKLEQKIKIQEAENKLRELKDKK